MTTPPKSTSTEDLTAPAHFSFRQKTLKIVRNEAEKIEREVVQKSVQKLGDGVGRLFQSSNRKPYRIFYDIDGNELHMAIALKREMDAKALLQAVQAKLSATHPEIAQDFACVGMLVIEEKNGTRRVLNPSENMWETLSSGVKCIYQPQSAEPAAVEEDGFVMEDEDGGERSGAPGSETFEIEDANADSSALPAAKPALTRKNTKMREDYYAALQALAVPNQDKEDAYVAALRCIFLPLPSNVSVWDVAFMLPKESLAVVQRALVSGMIGTVDVLKSVFNLSDKSLSKESLKSFRDKAAKLIAETNKEDEVFVFGLTKVLDSMTQRNARKGGFLSMLSSTSDLKKGDDLPSMSIKAIQQTFVTHVAQELQRRGLKADEVVIKGLAERLDGLLSQVESTDDVTGSTHDIVEMMADNFAFSDAKEQQLLDMAKQHADIRHLIAELEFRHASARNHPHYSKDNFIDPRSHDCFIAFEEDRVSQLIKSVQGLAGDRIDVGIAPGRNPSPRRAERTVGKLIVQVIEARGLLGKDKSGYSDPYCNVTMKGGNDMFRTQTIQQTLSPMWNEEMIFDVTTSMTKLKISVKDEDPMLDILVDKIMRFKRAEKDDFLGQIKLSIDDLRDPDQEPIDQWYQLEKRQGKAKVAGEIHIRTHFLYTTSSDKTVPPHHRWYRALAMVILANELSQAVLESRDLFDEKRIQAAASEADESKSEQSAAALTCLHTWTVVTLKKFTYCQHCHAMIYGMSKQGVQCRDCGMIVHHKCKGSVVGTCTGGGANVQFESDDVLPQILVDAVSAPARWILSEYGLRYGVGHLYRKLVYLEFATRAVDFAMVPLSVVRELLIDVSHALDRVKMAQLSLGDNNAREGSMRKSRSSHNVVYGNAIGLTRDEENILKAAVRSLHAHVQQRLTHYTDIWPEGQVAPDGSLAQCLGIVHAVLSNEMLTQYCPEGRLTREVKPFIESCVTKGMAHMFQRLIMVAEPGGVPEPSQQIVSLMDLCITVEDAVASDNDFFKSEFEEYIDIVALSIQTYSSLLGDEVVSKLHSIDPSGAGVDILPLYSRVAAFNEQVHRLRPESTLIPAEELFKPFVVGFIDQMGPQLRTWTMAAATQDKCEPLSPSVLHSSSVVDVFSAYHQVSDIVEDLKWPIAEDHADLAVRIARVVGPDIEGYARAQSAPVTASKDPDTKSEKPKTALNVFEQLFHMQTPDRADGEGGDTISVSNLVRMNNVESARLQLFSFAELIDQWLPGPDNDSHTAEETLDGTFQVLRQCIDQMTSAIGASINKSVRSALMVAVDELEVDHSMFAGVFKKKDDGKEVSPERRFEALLDALGEEFRLMSTTLYLQNLRRLLRVVWHGVTQTYLELLLSPESEQRKYNLAPRQLVFIADSIKLLSVFFQGGGDGLEQRHIDPELKHVLNVCAGFGSPSEALIRRHRALVAARDKPVEDEKVPLSPHLSPTLIPHFTLFSTIHSHPSPHISRYFHTKLTTPEILAILKTRRKTNKQVKSYVDGIRS